MTNPELSTAIHSYKHAVLAYLNFDYWAKIVPVAEKALKTPHRDTGESLTAGLLAVDFLTWSRQVQRGKEMLATVERVADETGQAYPEYISNLLKAYQSCIKATDYEKAYGYFYRSWATGPHHEDLFALKRAQVMALKCGRSDLIHEAIAELYKTHSFSLSTIPFMAGMVSFGLEQAGDYSGAERVARDGYTCPKAATDDIWLDHALVHSLYFQGPNRQSDALQLFLDRHTSWDDHRESLCPFIYTHCFWHWALVLVEAGRFDEALRIFDRNLWWEGRESTTGMFTSVNLQDDHVIANALGLLWKLQCHCSQSPNEPISTCLKTRWRAVAAVAVEAPSWLTHVDPLLDVLLVRGLIESDRLEDADILVESIKNSMSKEQYNIAQAVYQCCLDPTPSSRSRLLGLKDTWHVVGGSEEQRLCLLELATSKPCVCGIPQ